MSNEQDSVQRLAEIMARFDTFAAPKSSAPQRITADAEYVEQARRDVPYLLSLIDSLTVERDNAVWRADMLDAAGRVLHARAQAAEAEVKRLREALRKVEIAHFDQWCALCLGGEAPALHKPGCPVGAALATPPSEGEQS